MGEPINRRDPKTDAIIKGVITLAVKQIMASLSGAVPFLGLPVIRNILEFLIKWFIELVVYNTILGINFLIIDSDIDAGVEKVEGALDEAITLPPDATPEKQEEVNEKIRESLRDLIRFGRAPL